MPQWALLAILSALFAACVPILGKRGLAGVDVTTATALRAVVMALFLAALSLLRSGWRMQGLALSTSGAVWVALSGLAGALSWLCYFSALEKGPASGVVALDRTSVIFAVVLAAIFLAEKLDMRTASGAVLIAVGATLIAWK